MMTKKFSCIGTAVAALIALATAGAASAHTISLGSFNAGSPGSVTLVMGTYSHGGGFPQGSMQLIAGPGIPPLSAIVALGSFTNTKPAQLVDGVNNFYADATPGFYGTLASDSYNSPTNTVGLGPVVDWQSATFTGLSAGLYTYQLSGMTAANWNNVNSFEANWTGTILITRAVVNPTPEPASLALVGLALAGLAFTQRRRAS